jgi:hypothetical protein
MGSDHGVCANVDVLLIKNGRLRETYDAVFAKGSKALTSGCIWTN